MNYVQKQFFNVMLWGAFVCVALFASAVVVSAQEADATAEEDIAAIAPAGIAPDSPFYATDRFFERVGLFFAFNRSARAARLLVHAEERLSEARVLAESGDARAEALVLEYDSTLASASIEAELSGNEGTEAVFSERAARHAATFDRVIAQVPEQAKDNVRAARDRYVENHIAVMRSLAEKAPERAAEAFAMASERRANAIARAAEDESEDAPARAREARERAEEFGKYAAFGEEISLIARKLRTGEATVEQLVERATTQHIQVLEDVRARVPQEALVGIDSALQNAQRVRAFRAGALSDVDVDARIEARKTEAEVRREDALQRAESFAPVDVRERIQRGRVEIEERGGEVRPTERIESRIETRTENRINAVQERAAETRARTGGVSPAVTPAREVAPVQ
ncbi:hypothetical protein HYT04_01990 [Candidatus Kaiserbacteria bacterium]|nr:hypothetical protein [Candidatus Kaiserbacteria bacterium]